MATQAHNRSSPGIEGLGQELVSRLSTDWPERSHCQVVSCALARRGVRRGAAEASGEGDGVRRVWA